MRVLAPRLGSWFCWCVFFFKCIRLCFLEYIQSNFIHYIERERQREKVSVYIISTNQERAPGRSAGPALMLSAQPCVKCQRACYSPRPVLGQGPAWYWVSVLCPMPAGRRRGVKRIQALLPMSRRSSCRVTFVPYLGPPTPALSEPARATSQVVSVGSRLSSHPDVLHGRVPV